MFAGLISCFFIWSSAFFVNVEAENNFFGELLKCGIHSTRGVITAQGLIIFSD
jgi:hypothetical protein